MKKDVEQRCKRLYFWDPFPNSMLTGVTEVWTSEIFLLNNTVKIGTNRCDALVVTNLFTL